jgi:D-alanyl-D-alanine carboxypeptidase/D-alanyl-D-alanine-endopeptidase (penicillin-binding protein 4)
LDHWSDCRRYLVLLLVLGCFGLEAGALGQEKGGALPPLPVDDEEVANEVATPTIEPRTDDVATPEAPPVGGAASAPEVPAGPTPVPDRSLGCQESFPGVMPPALKKKIDGLLANKDLAGGQVSVLAVAYPEGTVLYAHDADTKVNPASVSKLFTAATALAFFGPDRRWQTSVVAGDGECPDLYLVGGGDPGLFEADLAKLVDGIKSKGTTCVNQLYFDVSLFDDAILPPHYNEKKSDAHWRPKIGALGMSDGSLDIRVIPGSYPDAAPQVKIVPSNSCVMVDSRALTVETVEEGQGLGVSVRASDGKVVVQVTGQIPMKSSNGVLVRKAIPHPDQFTACFFRDALRSRGIKVKARDVIAGKAPVGREPLASLSSNSLKTDLRRMQRWSKNFVAEQLVKLHGEGRCTPLTFECGLRVMRQTLARFHLNHRCLRLENGSGLFDANRVSAAQVVRLLIEVANQKDWGTLYREALPLGGQSGTLKDRMKKVKRPVRAKTGTLDYHSSLAGYIDRRSGGYIAFAILMAETKTSAYRMRLIQDQVVAALATVK